MIIQNNNRSPNSLHNFLIENNCTPIYLKHNAEYNEEGIKVTEATEIYIEIEEENQAGLTSLVSRFMTQ